jgi:hypothetical protein
MEFEPANNSVLNFGHQEQYENTVVLNHQVRVGFFFGRGGVSTGF